MMEKSMLLLILLCFLAHSIHLKYEAHPIQHQQAQCNSLQIKNLKVFNWNMGSGHCRQQRGEYYPNCDTYIVDATNKLMNFVDKYDIFCLQEFPKYYRKKQRQQADKIVEQFAIKNKYSIFRKQRNTDFDIAILSKIPLQSMDQLDLSYHYGAQKMKISLGGLKIQVGNVHAPWKDNVPDLNTRKQDIRKYIRWLNQTKGDINIVAGDFNMKFADVEQIIKELKPFGNKVMNRACYDIDCIFVFGEAGWPFVNNILMVGEDHPYAIDYTYTFSGNAFYRQNRAVTIQTFFTTYGDPALLGVNGIVQNKGYQAAFFSDLTYMGLNKNYKYKFIVETFSDQTIRISCPYDAVSYLGLDDKITSDNTYQWAYWMQWNYLRSNPRYQKDPRFKQILFSYELTASYDFTSFLATNNRIKPNNFEWAHFATKNYIQSDRDHYNNKMILKDLK